MACWQYSSRVESPDKARLVIQLSDSKTRWRLISSLCPGGTSFTVHASRLVTLRIGDRIDWLFDTDAPNLGKIGSNIDGQKNLNTQLHLLAW